MISSIISIATFILFLIIIIQSIIFKKRGIESTGNPPIQQKYVGIGKLSLIITWILIIVQSHFFNLRLIQLPPYFESITLVLVVVGLIYTISSFLILSDANKVGLPNEKTILRTKGIYRLSRNPMYVGFLLFSIASCIYSLNPLTVILAIIALGIHHKIVLSEEDFLKERFGNEYCDYKKKIRRYI